MPSVIVAGGGLAGLAAAAALGGAGYRVDVFEARAFLGGRATSYAVPSEDGAAEVIDNCQHVLLRCCVNLLDFYLRLGVSELIRFHRTFYFLEPGGRVSTMRAGLFPQPFHFAESFVKMRFLSIESKYAVARAMLAIRSEYPVRKDLDKITMLDWLREKKQTQQAIDRFWNPVLVSAINEDLATMAAVHGFQVFQLGFLARSDSYEMGIPAVPLAELYGPAAWVRIPTVRFHMRTPVKHLGQDGALVNDTRCLADFYVSALPSERLQSATDIRPPQLEHSPITGIHLWFDRSITDLPHASLLDRTIQWMFNKEAGKYIQLVVSASRSLTPMSKGDIVALALRELAEFFPAVQGATLLKSHVVKEVRATFSAGVGLERERPVSETVSHNVFLAGDWIRSGWPATMEGAIRSGYLAAEAVTRAAGNPLKFLLPDVS